MYILIKRSANPFNSSIMRSWTMMYYYYYFLLSDREMETELSIDSSNNVTFVF